MRQRTFLAKLCSTLGALALSICPASAVDSDGDGLTDAWEAGEGRYRLVEGNFTWEEANVDAEKRGGHLATITSAQEWETLKRIVPETISMNENKWLGATDANKEGDWRWITGEAWGFDYWHPGSPNSYRGYPENYLYISRFEDRGWDDLPNEPLKYPINAQKMNYILEFGYPTDPRKADSDGDGFSDKIETQWRCDPNDDQSVPFPANPHQAAVSEIEPLRRNEIAPTGSGAYAAIAGLLEELKSKDRLIEGLKRQISEHSAPSNEKETN